MKGISGFWVGNYAYDDLSRPPVSFDAELTHQGLQLSGIITEPNSFENPGAAGELALVTAEIIGMISGDALSFTKTYVGPRVPIEPVTYQGNVDAAHTEIAGTWNIGAYTGTFEMRRDGPVVGVKVKQMKAEAGLEMEVQPKK